MKSAIDLFEPIRIVLVESSHSGNIGAAARAMKVMGLSRLVLVAPRAAVDEVARARASGANDVLAGAKLVANLEDALAGCVYAVAATSRAREISPATGNARQAADALLQHAGQGECALVFGNETSGLTNEHVRLCQAVATIPTSDTYGSLNLAAAVQVFSYELRMSMMASAGIALRPEPAGITDVPATLDEIEGLMHHCETALATIGFFDPANPKRLLPRLRRLFGKARLEREEVNILRGILGAAERRHERDR
jgi:tRNA/rRNA methyltransferase